MCSEKRGGFLEGTNTDQNLLCVFKLQRKIYDNNIFRQRGCKPPSFSLRFSCARPVCPSSPRFCTPLSAVFHGLTGFRKPRVRHGRRTSPRTGWA